MTWHRCSFVDPSYGWPFDGPGLGDGPFFAGSEDVPLTCIHTNFRKHFNCRIAWTGLDVRLDFFALIEGIILISERAARVLSKTGMQGLQFDSVSHIGIGQYTEDTDELALETSIVGDEINSFRRLRIEHRAAFDRQGVEIVVCPVCGKEEMKVDGKIFDPATQLVFPPNADIVYLQALLKMYFASDAMRMAVEGAGLKGIVFFDLLNLVGELERIPTIQVLAARKVQEGISRPNGEKTQTGD